MTQKIFKFHIHKILLAILLLTRFDLQAQEDTEIRLFSTQPSTYVTNINHAGNLVKASVCNNCSIAQPEARLMYNWVLYNRLNVTRGGYEGRLLHGDFVIFNIEGKLIEKGVFSRGLKNGKWTNWYVNGMLRKNEEWKYGMRHGLFREYLENGKLKTEEHYRNDLLHGKVVVYENEGIVSVKQYKRGIELKQKQKKKQTPLSKPEILQDSSSIKIKKIEAVKLDTLKSKTRTGNISTEKRSDTTSGVRIKKEAVKKNVSSKELSPKKSFRKKRLEKKTTDKNKDAKQELPQPKPATPSKPQPVRKPGTSPFIK